MSVTLDEVSPRPLDRCGICRKHLKRNVALHTGENGNRHPFHKNCIELCLEIIAVCPVCKIEISIPMKQRISIIRNSENRNLFLATFIGLSALTTQLTFDYLKDCHHYTYGQIAKTGCLANISAILSTSALVFVGNLAEPSQHNWKEKIKSAVVMPTLIMSTFPLNLLALLAFSSIRKSYYGYA